MIRDTSIHDWQQICLDLRTHYKPLYAISKEIGASWQNIGGLSRGRVYEPKHSVGVKLLALHKRYCNDSTRNGTRSDRTAS